MTKNRRHQTALLLFAVIGALFFLYEFDERGSRFDPASARAKSDRSGVYDLARARMLTKVIGHVRSHYVDPDRVDPKGMVVAAMRAIQAHVPEVKVAVHFDKKKQPRAIDVSVADSKKTFSLERVGDLYEFNWKLMDVFGFLQRQLPPSSNLEDVEYTAVNGVLSTLDPHSVLVSPQVYREMQLGTHGRFGGLGVSISVRDGVLTIMSVMDGTPAEQVRLASGDTIVQIGEESTINMPLNEAVNRLRGAPGTAVTIWVMRNGWSEPRAYSITREEIRIRSVDHRSLGDGVGYVRIRNFQGNTADDLDTALVKLRKEAGGMKALVLDLRENPGGLLDQAVKISDRFLADGTVVTTVRERGKEREERHATRAGTLAKLPIVVLINRGSASASEIVAGAIKHNERGLVVGRTSFGKGSVQVIYQIDDAALKLTIAQYLTPGEISIQSVGIVPDIEIQRLSVEKEAIDLYPRESEFEGEAGLESHLESENTHKGIRPSMRLRMLEDEEGREKPKDSAKSVDALVRLAKAILVAAPLSNRNGALVQATGLLNRRQDEENTRLVERFQGLGVDWSSLPIRGKKPKPTVSLEVLKVPQSDKGTPIKAGDEVTIVARVTGDAKGDLWRVHGVLNSQIAALSGRELVFGHVEAGKMRQWSTTVKLPRSLESMGERLTLDLYADGAPLGVKASLSLKVLGLPTPRFAYSYRVLDPEGNGDGLVQRGEQLTLAVRITNVGKGDGDDVLVTVRNESGEDVFIDKGRHRIGALAVGKDDVATFHFRVRPNLKSQDVNLQLAVIDQGRKIWYRDDLSLPAFPAALPKAKKENWQGIVKEGTVHVRGGANRDSVVVAEVDAQTNLSVIARAGEWLKVHLGAEPPYYDDGWIHESRLKKIRGGATKWDAIRHVRQHEPPRLTLEASIQDTLITKDSKIPISGEVAFVGEDLGRRYVYIFRNDDKVFFQTTGTAANEAENLSFSAQIELVEGANTITVVAREGEDDVTRRSVMIYRL